MFRKFNLISILVSFLLSLNLQAKEFSFSNKKFKLDEAEFTRVFKPKLAHILDGYYDIIKSFAPENSTIAELGKNNFALLESFHKISNIDLPNNETYAEILKIRTVLNNNEELILKLKRRSVLTFPEQNLDTLFFQEPLIKNILKNYLLLSELIESLNIVYSFSPENLNSKITNQIKEYLHFYVINVDILISYFVNLNRQEDIEVLWNSFFKPIRDNVLINNDYEFFGNRFESFNFDWNDFHHKSSLDKSIHQDMLDRIHSEWNQILREIF
ncbi:MAG: hypothetical protein U0T83_04775 [Bacteriovoracaceae bacterium]